ncbi:MAG: peroxiredoxin, partial [Tissierellaceae bacterium]
MSKYNFTLKETDGADISLEDFKGKNVILYFYPKDNTSGCTTEAIEFRDLNDEFEKLDTVILGISRD